MSLFDLCPEDEAALKGLCFEPQKAAAILNRCRLLRPSEICHHPHVERLTLKVGEQSNDGWTSLQSAYRCVNCGMPMEPASYKPKDLP